MRWPWPDNNQHNYSVDYNYFDVKRRNGKRIHAKCKILLRKVFSTYLIKRLRVSLCRCMCLI